MTRGTTAGLILTFAVAGAGAPHTAARTHELASPDGRITVAIETGEVLTWSVTRDGVPLLRPSPISVTLSSGRFPGPGAAARKTERRSVDTVIRPVVPEKNAVVPDRYEELRLAFDDGALIVRAYDDGVAYRFVTELADSVTVRDEQATFRLAGGATAVFGADSLWMSHQEPLYEWVHVDSLEAGTKGLLPLVLEVDDGPRLAIMESALEAYPGMHIAAGEDRTFVGVFPPAAAEEDLSDIQNVGVRRYADHIARTEGTRDFPWRIVAIADDDRALLENQIVFRLAPGLRIDASWIRPGKVAWDWWNDWNIHGVDFRAGINQRTYRHYIDFAAEYGLEYVILDLGWSPLDDLETTENDIDVPALVEYGRERDVGVILWALWKPLDLDMERVLDTWQEWGVAGTKVDYMQRDDQAVVEFYWRLAREAAEREMLIDYHGAYKPAGLRRAYPNVITREGVRGLEYNKWSSDITPEHDVTLPFTRMLAGPMDYTPGAMVNAAPRNHRDVFSRPMSQGTRAHQMALYVVYESPLQMLADNPTHYREEPEVTRFIADVPTTWDETRALMGESGDYVVLARRKGEAWWVGALTDGEPRTLNLDLSFLGAGRYDVVAYSDGINADRYAEDHVRTETTARRTDALELRLAPGGGWVARFGPAQE
ncbi:MAG: glycoside hydrolase family 97 protein [Gemmatimonadota bacterium]